jgi:uncharacterized protein YyaL (SSP411 family)
VPNRLARESSAYLQQHKDNPVDWYPWGDEAFERARRENRPVLVSIGYSSCHWCHVMERESFEDAEIARRMNEALVCIKVDREERPDVDQIYMDTVVRLTGHGGWPLNVFCTPDGRPFFGGTYFPPTRARGLPAWPEVVESVARLFRERRGDVEQQASQIVAALRQRPSPEGGGPVGREALTELCRVLLERADRTHGGFGAAPKFPTPTNLEAMLLASAEHAAVQGTLEHVVFTLKRMARGGIYDQIGGGFHRYSTDAQWLVPHFEKMLYDQGQLLRVYAEAYRQTRDEELVWPIDETIAWLEREMRSPEGGFHASLDADSEGEEGRFYVWTRAEIEAVLGAEDGAAFCDAYGVVPGGNFERTGSSVLSHGMAGSRPRFAAARARLLAAREVRVRPATDRKQIASWIGYAIGGLATAGASCAREDWVAAAARAADFVLERLVDPARGLLRVWDGERARIPAFLDDHASLLNAFLDLHRAGAGERYAVGALGLAEAIRERFYAPESRQLFFTPADGGSLVVRPRSDPDGATPAAMGLAVLGLVRLAELSGRRDLREVATDVIEGEAALLLRAPYAAPTLARAAALLEAGLGVGLILGEPGDRATQELAQRARTLLGPEDAVVVAPPGRPPPWLAPELLEGRGLVDARPTAYLCRGRSCSLPACDPESLTLPPA